MRIATREVRDRQVTPFEFEERHPDGES